MNIIEMKVLFSKKWCDVRSLLSERHYRCCCWCVTKQTSLSTLSKRLVVMLSKLDSLSKDVTKQTSLSTLNRRLAVLFVSLYSNWSSSCDRSTSSLWQSLFKSLKLSIAMFIRRCFVIISFWWRWIRANVLFYVHDSLKLDSLRKIYWDLIFWDADVYSNSDCKKRELF